MNVLYPENITYNKEDARYFVDFPDTPEAITEGVFNMHKFLCWEAKATD